MAIETYFSSITKFELKSARPSDHFLNKCFMYFFNSISVCMTKKWNNFSWKSCQLMCEHLGISFLLDLLHINLCIYVRILWSSSRKLEVGGLSGIWTDNHWILFRRPVQAMSSTHTHSQFCAATPISSSVQCQISFRPLPSSFATFILIEYIDI